MSDQITTSITGPPLGTESVAAAGPATAGARGPRDRPVHVPPPGSCEPSTARPGAP